LVTTHSIRRKRPQLALPLFLATVAVVTAVYMGLRFVLARGWHRALPAFVSRRVAPPPPSLTPVTPASASAAAEPPLISVDSLPVASTETSPKAGRTGRVVITAAPGSCMVTVDGTPRGVTPTTPMDLLAGSHTVRCDPPGGKSRSTTIVVLAGSVTPLKFDLTD
jgi:hypothetical protein